MDREQLRALAKALVAKTDKLYAPCDRCPMCGYDAYWGYDSIEESEEAVFEALVEAAGIDGYAGSEP